MTIESKTAKNGATIWYVDGKRVSKNAAIEAAQKNAEEKMQNLFDEFEKETGAESTEILHSYSVTISAASEITINLGGMVCGISAIIQRNYKNIDVAVAAARYIANKLGKEFIYSSVAFNDMKNATCENIFQNWHRVEKFFPAYYEKKEAEAKAQAIIAETDGSEEDDNDNAEVFNLLPAISELNDVELIDDNSTIEGTDLDETEREEYREAGYKFIFTIAYLNNLEHNRYNDHAVQTIEQAIKRLQIRMELNYNHEWAIKDINGNIIVKGDNATAFYKFLANETDGSEEDDDCEEIPQWHIDHLKENLEENITRYWELVAREDELKTHAAEKKALSEALTAKWGKDWASNRIKAVESLFSNDEAKEVKGLNNEQAISDKANQSVEDKLCIINGKRVSVAEYVQFCKDIIAENEPIRAEAWFEMEKALAADKCEEHDAWLDEYAEAGFTIRQCVSDIEKLTGEIVPVDESYLEGQKQISDTDSANLGDSKAEPKSDDFTSKLAELEAAKADAQAKEDAAKAVYKAAADETEKRSADLQKFLDEHAARLCDKLQALAPAQRMELITVRGTREFCRDFTDLYVDAPNSFGRRFIITYYNGRILAHYDTPAQVETVVINLLKEAIGRGDKEFTFPTVEEIKVEIKPKVENRECYFTPKIHSIKVA